ncbi:hypothetical protein B0T11DRAFT_58937 [Plectosphaerella cucumerina]|uniref:Uncharacterized protein n=1 Tax=Plectosphaerella cucumerina TaxID=40658 RepID=A0A8K0X643_9PEZI|nr:hypothetical protein B0T11DRAFT_58937 [Plectosphaerella cucumerina]
MIPAGHCNCHPPVTRAPFLRGSTAPAPPRGARRAQVCRCHSGARAIFFLLGPRWFIFCFGFFLAGRFFALGVSTGVWLPGEAEEDKGEGKAEGRDELEAEGKEEDGMGCEGSGHLGGFAMLPVLILFPVDAEAAEPRLLTSSLVEPTTSLPLPLPLPWTGCANANLRARGVACRGPSYLGRRWASRLPPFSCCPTIHRDPSGTTTPAPAASSGPDLGGRKIDTGVVRQPRTGHAECRRRGAVVDKPRALLHPPGPDRPAEISGRETNACCLVRTGPAASCSTPSAVLPRTAHRPAQTRPHPSSPA